MQLAPNGTIIDGVVREVKPREDGIGRDLLVDVKSAAPARGKKDFLNAAKGDQVRLFLGSPAHVEVGQRYRLETTVLGGPSGERAVVESLGRPAKAPRR